VVHQHHTTLVAVMAGTAVIPFIARRLRIPSAALEIVFGVLLFNFVFQTRPDWFLFIQELGFIYLMFIAGMELDLTGIRNSGKSTWYILVSLLSFSVTPLLFILFGQSYFLGLAVAMISAGIVIPVLKELQLDQTKLGRDIIGVALTGELLSILVLTLLDAYQLHGFTFNAVLELFWLGMMFGATLIVLKLLHLAAWWNPLRVEKVMQSEDPVEEGIRMVATVAFAGGMLAAFVGAEPILGSFLAGLVFSMVFKNKGVFEEKINAVGFGFLVPFFFVGVGASLDIRLLASFETVFLAVTLTLMVLVSNLYPILLARPLQLNLREAAGMSVLLSAPLSMIVVAGTLGEKMGLIDLETTGALVLTGLLASIVYPSIFRPLGRKLMTESSTSSV